MMLGVAGCPRLKGWRTSNKAERLACDMHPKKVTVLKVTGVDLVTLFYFLVSCNTAYLFYCSRLSDKSVSSVSKQLQVFIIANTLISVNLL